MAYPFHAAPTFRELKEKLLADYGVEFVEGCHIQDGDGNPHEVWHFRRQMGNDVLTYACEQYDDDEVISFHLIRSICKQLDVPFKQDNLFGLNLG